MVSAVLFTVSVRAADAVHFVVGPIGYTFTNSYILPLSNPEDIQTARKWVATGEGLSNSDYLDVWDYAPWQRIRLGSDGINRDVLQPGQPLWSWHVEAFTQWGPSTFVPGWPYRDPLQLEQLVLGGEFEDNTEMAFSGGFSVVAELNAPVELFYHQRLPLGTSTTVLLYWSHDIPSATYTVEWTRSLNPPDWQPLDYEAPGVARLAEAILEVNSAVIGRAFFRLMAE
jgi:hypothetical protein